MEEEQIWGTRETEGVEGRETAVEICLRKEIVFNKKLKFKIFLIYNNFKRNSMQNHQKSLIIVLENIHWKKVIDFSSHNLCFL